MYRQIATLLKPIVFVIVLLLLQELPTRAEVRISGEPGALEVEIIDASIKDVLYQPSQ
jgi:hypothetical protein